MSEHTSIDRYTIEQACQDAGAVSPIFQPMFDLERDAIWGYEVLAKIQGPLDVPTPVWFEAAAQYGLEGALEARMVRSGLSVAERLPAGEALSVNVTPRALRSPQLRAMLDRQDRFDATVFEVAEVQLGEEDLAPSLESFRAAGGRLAVEGLGAGATALREIVHLRPDLLKLDRSLVSRIDAEPAKQLVADLVVSMATRLGASVAAVGVERREELEALRALGVSLAQGFLFGPRYATLEEAQARA